MHSAFTFFVHTAQKPPKAHVLLDITKGAFHLDAPVHPQFTSFFAGQPCQILCTVLDKFFGNI